MSLPDEWSVEGQRSQQPRHKLGNSIIAEGLTS
jgi:hypothetical protein